MINGRTRSLFGVRGVMRVCVVLSVFVLGACGGGGGSDSGGSGGGLSTNACSAAGLNAKIINGTECDQTGSPIVSINLYLDDGSTALCSGTMVQSKYVLTAGHCFLPGQTTPGEGSPVYGASIVSGGREIFASTVFIHPEYFSSNSDGAVFNDVAVLQLTASPNLPTLPLLVSTKAAPGSTIAILGYGLDENGGVGVLRSGEMAVSTVTPNHIFSEFDGSGSNTCNGDSGGPALLRFNDAAGSPASGIVGITSTGSNENCSAGDVSLFANTQEEPILSFIKRVVPGVAVR